MIIDQLIIKNDASVKDALLKLELTGKELLLLVDHNHRLQRTISDGDLRRLILLDSDLDKDLSKLPKMSPITLSENYTLSQAHKLMLERQISQIPVVNEDFQPIDLISSKQVLSQIHLSPPHLGTDELNFVKEAFDTNWIAPVGPNLEEFERAICKELQVSDALALSSGTAAIHLGLLSLGVNAGDVVLCSSLTFAGSAFPIRYIGAIPHFIDSEPITWNMCPESLEKALIYYKSKNISPKAAIVVDIYGQIANFSIIQELCDAYRVPIIEDAAESLGATQHSKAAGTFGNVGILSFNGNKIITTSGGGMLVSNNPELIKKARYLSTQAKLPADHYEHSEIGFNYRMSNVLAGIGRGQLQVLTERVNARRSIYARYQDNLTKLGIFEWAEELPCSLSTRWLTVLRLKNTKRLTPRNLIQYLHKKNIEARLTWKPMHMQPVFHQHLFTHIKKKPVSEIIFDTGFCLPSGSNLTFDQVDTISDHICDLVSQLNE